MRHRPLFAGLLILGATLAGCGGSDAPSAATDATSAAQDAASATDATDGAGDDASAADFSGVDACAVLTDDAIDQSLTARLEREVTVRVERTPGTSDTEETGGPQRTCDFAVNDEGGFYSWTVRIVSKAYYDDQKTFAGTSAVTTPAIAGADDSFGFDINEQVWARQGDKAVTIENSSATQGLSLLLIEQILATLG